MIQSSLSVGSGGCKKDWKSRTITEGVKRDRDASRAPNIRSTQALKKTKQVINSFCH